MYTYFGWVPQVEEETSSGVLSVDSLFASLQTLHFVVVVVVVVVAVFVVVVAVAVFVVAVAVVAAVVVAVDPEILEYKNQKELGPDDER